MRFLLAQDAREFIKNHYAAEFELAGFLGLEIEDVNVEQDGHCGFVHNGKAYFLGDEDLIQFANQI